MKQIKYGACLGYDYEIVIEKFTVSETQKTYKVSARYRSVGWGSTFLKSEPVPWGDTPEEAKEKLVEKLRKEAVNYQQKVNYYLARYEAAVNSNIDHTKIVDRTEEIK